MEIVRARFRRENLSAIFVVALAMILAGCAKVPRTVRSNDPEVKIPAIRESVAARDESAASELVKSLESDDPAVRFYAIEGLHRLTGEDFGYVYYADDDSRAAAVKRWQAWLGRNQPPQGMR